MNLASFAPVLRWIALTTLAIASAPPASSQTQCLAPPPGLVAWWTGDGDATDLLGVYNGVLENGASFASGEVGQAFNLDGIDDRVLIGDSRSLNITRLPSWTVQAWINPTALQTAPWPTIYGVGHWHVSLGLNKSSGQLDSWINNSNQAISTIPINLGRWNHVALVYDGSYRAFYVNGSFAGASPTPQIVHDDNGAAIGQVVDPRNDSSFRGLVDEVAVFARALTSNELAEIYAAGSAGMCSPPLPPSIHTSLSNLTVSGGQTATFFVAASGPRPLRYQWQCNRTNLAADMRIAGTTTPSLSISDVKMTDVGSYRVVVNNDFGSAESDSAMLILNPTHNGTTFDSGTDNWKIADLEYFRRSDGGDHLFTPLRILSTLDPQWSQTGGSPDGHIYQRDPSGNWWMFSAPPALLGNRPELKNGTFDFDLKVIPDGTDSRLTPPLMLTMVGGGMTLFYLATCPGDAWTHYSIPFSEGGWTSDSDYNTPATGGEIQQTLSDLTGLYISGDWYNGAEVAALDNTCLKSRLIVAPIRSGELIEGDSLRFAASGISGLTTGVRHHNWSFGDGRSSLMANPGLLRFDKAGTRVVTLGLSDGPSSAQVVHDTCVIAVVTEPGPLPDFAVEHIGAPSTVAAGQPAQVVYSVVNEGNGIVSGRMWTDALYLSRDEFLDLNDHILASTSVSIPLGCGKSYTNSLTVAIPVATDGPFYLVLAVDDHWRVLERRQLNNERAVLMAAGIPVLTNDVVRSGAFVGSGEAHVYRIEVPAGQSLYVNLEGDDDQGATELYLKYGSMPTRGSYDYASHGVAGPNAQVVAANARGGTWYVLAYPALVGSNGAYLLQAHVGGLELHRVVPDHHGRGSKSVLTLRGAGFVPEMRVELVGRNGTLYPATSISVESFTRLSASFEANTVPVGLYDVRVHRSDGGSAELAGGFRVVEGSGPRLFTRLIAPGNTGIHALATLYVEYGNEGDEAMPAPLLVLTGTQDGREKSILTLDRSRVTMGFWSTVLPDGFGTSVQIWGGGVTPGLLQPGESIRVPVYFAGLLRPASESTPVAYTLGVLSADNATPVNWPAFKESMRPVTVSAEAWEQIWANFVAQVGTTWGDYVRMLDDNAGYLVRLGLRVADVGTLLAFELQQANGLTPIRTLARAVDATAEAPGLSLSFSRSFPVALSQRCELGPLGRGWSHNWQRSLSADADGAVTVHGPGGSRRVFLPDSRVPGRYFAEPGDYGTLRARDGGGFTVSESDGVAWGFHADGRLDYLADVNGNRITAGHTGGRLTSLTHSRGPALQIAYNGAGRIASVTDAVGRQTRFAYDATAQHLVSATAYDGRMTEYKYGPDHALTEASQTSCGCARRFFTYDAQRRLAGVARDGGAEAVTFGYGPAGEVAVTNALGQASSLFFDHRGLLVQVRDALGNRADFAFDDRYNLATVSDPAGRTYQYDYDTRGNLSRIVDPLGNPTAFGFTTTYNRLATVTDANGNPTRHTYDAKGNLTSMVYADASHEDWTYDTAGNPLTWTNRRGQTVRYSYDPAGRLTSKTFPDAAKHTYAYDARGNLTNAATLDSQLSTLYANAYAYDANDRLTNIVYPGDKFLAFTYDAAGRRASSLDHLGHLLTYRYDDAGRLETMTNELGQLVVRYAYDLAGRLELKTLGNGVYTTYTYDGAGQLLALTNTLPDTKPLSWFNYTYDSRGRRTSMDTHYGKWTYGYDDLGQLTRAILTSTDTNIPNQDLLYVYDPLGNRLRTVTNGVATAYTVNHLNQYPRVGDTTFEYDADGNLVREVSPRGTNIYTYNVENRLVAVTTPQGTWEYGYDGFGTRSMIAQDGRSIHAVVDPIGLGNVVAEYDASGQFLAKYDHGVGMAAEGRTNDHRFFYTFDGLGHTSDVTDAAAHSAGRLSFDPFGPLFVSEGADNIFFTFLGELGIRSEGSGLEFMRFRFMHAGTGRFISPDPLESPGRPQAQYSYCNNNPINAVDPLGLMSIHPDYLRDRLRYVRALAERVQDLAEKVEATIDVGEHVVALRELAVHHPGTLTADQGHEIWRLFKSIFRQIPFVGDALPGDDDNDNVHRAIDALTLVTRLRESGFFDLTDPPKVPSTAADSTITQTSASQDPNEKTGPAGYGATDFVLPAGTFGYRIDFENATNAVAPAQQVVITDPLDANLDPRTFALTAIGFSDQVIPVPDGSQYFQTIVPVTVGDIPLEVWIEAGIDLPTARVFAVLWTIDPLMGLPPAVDIGFLPPEDGTGRGQGYVTYTVAPRPGLATGTQIRNVAFISFDNQPPIATNLRDPHDPTAGTDPTKESLVTIDADAPTSGVLPLPAFTAQPQFTVAWSGADQTNGCGVADFDVYVSANGGAWSVWQTATTNTSGVFNGQMYTAYTFQTLARDHVGNREVKGTNAVPPARTFVTDNLPPAIDEIATQQVIGGALLQVSLAAADVNRPSQTLTFGLGPDAPLTSIIDPLTGLFEWRPDPSDPGSTNQVTVTVTDNGRPPMSAARGFTVLVLPRMQLSIERADAGRLALQAEVPLGRTYLLQNSRDLAAWSTLATTNVLSTPVLRWTFTPSGTNRYFRMLAP
jgi:RHS repeat-associated protein